MVLELKSLLMIALMAANSSIPPQAEPGDSSVREFAEMQAAADVAMTSLKVPFTVTQVAAAGGKAPTDGHLKIWKGTWYRQGQTESVEWKRFSVGSKSGAEELSAHAIWDGERCEDYTESVRGGRMRISQSKSGSFMGWIPPYFGLSLGRTKWYDVLRRCRTKVLGTEVVSGRKCLKVFVDFAHAASPEGEGHPEDTVTPLHVWIDAEETFLVWKCISFVSDEHAPDYLRKDPSLVIELAKRKYFPHVETLVQEARKLGNVWIATKGRIRLPGGPLFDEEEYAVDAAALAANVPLDPAIFHITPKPETVIHNQITDEYFYTHPTLGTRTETEKNLDELVEKVAREDHLPGSSPPVGSQPILLSSCGPQCLYFWLRLNGKSVPLKSITDRIKETEEGVSLQDMASTATDLHSPLVCIQAKDKEVESISGSFIAYLEGFQGHLGKFEKVGHYVIARNVGNQVRVVSLPDELVYMSKPEFRRVWTGHALVPPEVGAAVLLNSSRSKTRRAVLLGIAVVVLASSAFAYFRGRGKSKSPIVALPVASLLLAVAASFSVGGCRRAEAPPPSGHILPWVSVDGKSTYDAGLVMDGEVLKIQFDFKNSSANPLDLSASGSCGCLSLEVEPHRVGVGEKGHLNVRVNTAGKVGGIHEAVQLLDSTGRKLHTFWIVGKVKPHARIVPTPYLIDLGSVQTGAQSTHDIQLEVTGYEGFTPSIFEAAPTDKDSPVQWTVEWEKSISGSGNPEDLGRSHQVRKGTLRLVAVRPGVIADTPIEIAGKGKNGETIATTFIALKGKVQGGFGVQPEQVFLGTFLAEDSVPFEIRITPSGKIHGSPRVNPSSGRVSVDQPEATPEGYRLTGRVRGASSGMVQETLSIQWGDDSIVVVPITGKARQQK
jgi:hypothetical protein